MALSKSEIKSVAVDVLRDNFPEKSKKEIDSAADDLCDRLVTEYAGEVYEDDEDETDEDEVDARLSKFLETESSSEEDDDEG